MKERIISQYGRVLRKGSIKTIIDLNESLKIDFNFQMHNINDLVTEFDGIMPPNRISHYVLAFINKGSGKKIIGSHSFNIQPNMGLIIPKNMIHSTNSWSLDTSGYMLTFNDFIFSEYQFPISFLQLHRLFKISSTPYSIFDLEASMQVELLFNEIKRLSQIKEPQEQKLFILKLAELILLYQKEFFSQEKFSNKKDTLFDEFVELLESNYKSEKEVGYYASKLSIHSNYLNKLVRSSTKSSAKDYIDNRIVQEAKYLLISTSIPIKEIGLDLGFTDYNYFSRFFKKKTGQSPKYFRIASQTLKG